jgi:hypothetical protein
MNIIKFYINKLLITYPHNYKAELKDSALLLLRKLALSYKDIKFNSKSSFTVLTDKDRKVIMDELTSLPHFVYEGKGSSSVGRLKYKDQVIIYFKPKNKQGDYSPGKLNEKIFENNVKRHLNKPIDVVFKYDDEKYTLGSIKSITNSSHDDNHKYNKSDFILYNHRANTISLKQGGDFIWESSITRYKYVYDKFINAFTHNLIENLEAKTYDALNGKYIMWNPLNNKPYSRIFIKGFPDYNDDNIIFGNEVPKPIIIERTFKASDFVYSNSILTINVDKIYSTVADVEKAGKLPVLSFSRNISRPYGIDFKCIPENKTKYTYRANILEIPYGVLMDY